MRRRGPLRILLWLLPALVALVLVGCGHVGTLTPPWDRPAPPAGVSLQDLRSMEDLQQVFNRDTGHSRLILLVSPT